MCIYMRSLKDGFLHQVQSIKSGSNPTIFTTNQLIHLYSKQNMIREARNLFDEMSERNIYTWNTIITAYIRSHNLKKARALFDVASPKDSVTYNSMLSGYVNAEDCCRHEYDSVKLFVDMQREIDYGVRLDEFSFTTMLNLCAKLGLGRLGKLGRQLHCLMAKTGNDLSRFSVTSLLDMYSKTGCFEDAFRVFEIRRRDGVVDVVSKNAMIAACCREGDMEMASRLFSTDTDLNNAVSWNTMISGYVQNGYEEVALSFFVRMTENGIIRNDHSFASVLSACVLSKSSRLGKEVHAFVLKNAMIRNRFISSGIIDVYGKSGNVDYAESAYTTYGVGNTFATTSMIVGYSGQGKMVEARELFDSLQDKNSVVWTALLSGYVKSKQCDTVFELFRELVNLNRVLDGLILNTVLTACSQHAALEPGKQIHGYVLRTAIRPSIKLSSGLVNMYSKCGNLSYAEKVFQSVDERDSVVYNVMIAGYAHNGCDLDAVTLFDEMVSKRLEPDEVTFVALLSTCRHRGLVETGEKYFKSMTDDYGISPESDHYACMIDLYGRANQLDKAVNFMKTIPFELDAFIVGAFVNACKMNRNAELAKEAEAKMLRLEGDNGARYVQLAGVYAADGNWVEMERIMNLMKGKRLKKVAGNSWVYVENRVHVFGSGDISHSKTDDIYSILVCLSRELHETDTGLFE